MKTKYLIALFVLTTLSGMVAVVFFGLQPRPIPKINLSVFPSPSHVANAVLVSLPGELQESSIVVIGMNPRNPFLKQSLEYFLMLIQTQPSRFGAVVADESFSDLQVPTDLSFEHFSFAQQKDRLLSGLKTIQEKKVHLLMLVPQSEASHKIPQSLVSELQKSVGEQPIMSLIFSNFPRRREDESNLEIPCNTGPKDSEQTGSLGCLILQSSRVLYRKHLKAGTWVGLLNQVGGSDYVFLITPEI